MPQLSPGAVHPGVRQRPPRHSRPEQHPPLPVPPSPVPASPPEPAVQAWLRPRQAQVPIVDMGVPVGRLHAAPLQQSASVMHDDSAGRHSQRRVVVLQSCQPQQSTCAMHDPPVLWQQVCVPPGCIAQE